MNLVRFPRTVGKLIGLTPNVGVTYSTSTAMMGDHGGFAHDDKNEMLLVANPSFTSQTVSVEAQTIQVAPTMVEALV